MGEKIKVGQLSKLIVLTISGFHVRAVASDIRLKTLHLVTDFIKNLLIVFVLDKHAIPMKFCVSDIGYQYLKGNMSLLQDPPVEF